MAKENTKNLCYADAFKKALEAEKILPEQTRFVCIEKDPEKGVDYRRITISQEADES